MELQRETIEVTICAYVLLENQEQVGLFVSYRRDLQKVFSRLLNLYSI